jgi:predicted ATPase/DNA-binding winged helix-turn-helix (wHTH) protein
VSGNGRHPVYANGAWEIDLARRELRLRGTPVPLGGRAFDIIETLVLAAGMLVTKEDLMTQVWPGAAIEDNTLQVHISTVRRAFGADRAMLATSFGRGYRLLGEWVELAAGARNGLTQGITEAISPDAGRLTNIPQATSELIGRTDITRDLCNLLAVHRVVTLTGPGGIGKTTLALEAARTLLPGFQGEIWLVELMALADPGLVPSAVAAVLGLQPGGGPPSAASVAHAIGRRKLLLVLDNCEHLIDAAARLAEMIVQTCPNASILATSREVLRIDGEWVFRVPPLDVPAADNAEPNDVLSRGAVQLFIARTRMRNQDFAALDSDMAVIANICRRLEGIPLAIEFAAARAAVLGLHEVAGRLDDRFDLLTDGRRTALPRHRTLRAMLDWSYELLPASEQHILRRLAVFPGGFTLDAAAAVMASGGALSVVDGVANLVAKSLVTLDHGTAHERWRLLDTVRAYAQEKLAQTGDAGDAAQRQASFFLDLLTGPSADRETDRIDREIDNIRAALDWAFSPAGDGQIGAGLTAACVSVWTRLSLLGECRARVETALSALDASEVPRTEMILRAALGMALTYTSGPVDATKPNWQRVLDIADALGDIEYQLRSIYGLWLYEILICAYREARSLAEQFLRIAATVSGAPDVPTADRMMAMVLHYTGDQSGARTRAERSLAAPLPADRSMHTIRYGVDQRVGTLVQLARTLWVQGFPDQAMDAAEAALHEANAVGHANSVCLALADGACIVAMLSGDLGTAARFAALLSEHADRHALGVWRTYSRALRGRLLIEANPLGGAALLRSALADLRGTPSDIRFQLYLVWLTEVLGAAGQDADALAAIDEALERAERTGERWYLPELLRLRGELLLRSNASAEGLFARSLELAREQDALSWELRVSMSRVRMAPEDQAAKSALADTLARFNEGFDTADLRAAVRLSRSIG